MATAESVIASDISTITTEEALPAFQQRARLVETGYGCPDKSQTV